MGDGGIEDLTIDDDMIAEEEDPLKAEEEEYKDPEEDEDVEGALYDKELFAAELADYDEDVDFD